MSRDIIPQVGTDTDELLSEIDNLADSAFVSPKTHENTDSDKPPDSSTAIEDKAQPPPEGYWPAQLHTVGQFLQRPRKQWIVQDVLGAQDYAMLYGESGHGKTHILLDFAYACATGRQFADKFGVTRPLTVVYATGEGIGGLRDRIQAVSDFYDTQPENLHILADTPQLREPELPNGAYAFVAAWQQLAKVGSIPRQLDVLILDTLHNATHGANENSAMDGGLILRSLKFLRDKLGCAVVLSHHANKAGTSERGTTALRASMDAVVRCQKSGRDSFTMSCEKLKDGEQWQAQAFSLLAKTDSVRVSWDGDATTGTAATQTREKRVLSFLDENIDTRYTADEIAQEIKDDSPTAVSNILKRLRGAGSVQADKKKRTAKDGKLRDSWVYWKEGV